MAKKVRRIFLVAHQQYIDWLLNGKQIIVLLVLFFLMKYLSDPLALLSVDLGIPLQGAETFLAAVNANYIIPVIPLCFITLMSEFPKRNYEDINLFFHAGRSNWYYGQILFSGCAILTYLLEITVLFLVRTARISYLDNGWSPVMKQYMEKYMEVGKKHGVIAVVKSEVYHHFSPWEAFILTLFLLAGMFLMITLIMFLCNLLNKRTAGIVINVLLIVIGEGMLYTNSEYLSFLPLGNAVLQCQNRPVTRMTEWYEPVIYFLVFNIILIIMGRIRIKRVRL